MGWRSLRERKNYKLVLPLRIHRVWKKRKGGQRIRIPRGEIIETKALTQESVTHVQETLSN